MKSREGLWLAVLAGAAVGVLMGAALKLDLRSKLTIGLLLTLFTAALAVMVHYLLDD